MASRRLASAAKQVTPPPDLTEVVRNAARERPGLNATALKKHLPVSHQNFATPEFLKLLAENGDVFMFVKGKTPLFFPCEPLAEIDRKVSPGIASTPVEVDALKDMVADVAPGHEVVFDLWLKHAIARRALFAHPPVRPKGKKRYGATPDLNTSLKPVLKALQTALKKLDAQGVSREQVAEALLAELGVSNGAVRVSGTTEALPREASPREALRGDVSPREASPREASPRSVAPNAQNPSDGRSQFVGALKALSDERPREALLSVRELRPRTSLAKEQFDRIALELAREGFISLHHHDHAASLPESERALLIEDARGTFFNGIAPRRGHV